MEFTQEILLENLTQTVNGLYPFTLFINPTSINAQNKISKIIYDFDEQIVIKDYDFINDIDPRYLIQEHVFNSSGYSEKTHHIKIDVYQFGKDVLNFTVDLNLSFSDVERTTTSYFSAIHLVKSRMFGPDNELLYIFESQYKTQKTHIMPVLVTYKPYDQNTLDAIKQLSFDHNIENDLLPLILR